jgi:DnaK suppressor protein
MIVSILQLMGFPMAKPVHSRAEEAPYNKPLKASTQAPGNLENKQASSNRRDQLNAKSGKDPKSKSDTAKSKPAVKAAPKPVKAAAKAPAKTAAKVKPVVKTPVKSADTSPKPVAKAAPVAAAKAPAKTVSKPVGPTAPAKPPKAVAPAATPKPAVVSKPAVKPASPQKASPPMTTAATKPVSATAPTAAPAVVAQKTGRPSSRLAQLTVPSMAQAVASTAAKASYSQSIPSPVIVPVLPSSIKKDPKLANNWKTKPLAELTDADLMAMPDAEYMNDVQMAAFRLKLSTLKQEILNSAGETTEHLREDTSVVPDPADRATIEEEHALELRTRDRERKLLKKIEQSIGRIDAGDYGYCDETGEPIGVGRLLARPTATLSLEAQQRRELKQKMFGD